MNTKRDWYKNQPRGGSTAYRFAPKWDKNTILEIIKDINKSTDLIDIKVKLVKEYKIGLESAGIWIAIARRVMEDINNGMSIDDSLELDRERRNELRRKRELNTGRW